MTIGHQTRADPLAPRRVDAAPTVHPAYRPDIDGLRAVAVLSVVLFHFFPSLLPGGFVGVDVFFVISGHLISHIILGSLANGSFSFVAFYARRIRRIFPALLLVMSATLVMGWATLLATEYARLGKHVLGGAAFVSNLVLWAESGYFDPAAITKPLLHLWSLGIEEQFYLLWPFVLWACWRLRLNLLLVTATIATLSFIANLLATSSAPVAAFYSPWTRFWELMVGGLLAHAAHQRRSLPGAEGSLFGWLGKPQVSRMASISGVILLALSLAFVRESDFPGWQALLPAAGAALLILGGPHAGPNRKILSTAPLVALGLISFPLYLWHWPLASFARVVHGQTGPGTRAALLAASVVLAWATYAGIERRVKRANPSTPGTATLLVLLLFVGAAGHFFQTTQGLPERAAVQANLSLDDARAPLWPPFTLPCGGGAEDERFQCYVDSRAAPRFALLGDSKAGALFPGLFLTSAEDGTWLFVGSGKAGPLVPVLSDSRIYAHVRRPDVDAALRVVENTPSVETVVIAAATRALFGIGSDASIAELPGTRHFETALAGLDATVTRLLSAGKRVVLLIDNPTLPHIEDCIGRKTSSALLDRLVTARPHPDCRIPIAKHLEWSRPYRQLLQALEQRHPDKVSVLDTVPLLCDEVTGFCTPTDRQGRILYGVTDHISVHASVLVGRVLNSRLGARQAP